MSNDNTLPLAIGAAGVVGLLIGLAVQPDRFWSGLLVAALFGLTVALGSAIVLAVNGVAGARWLNPIIDLPIHVARTLPAPAAALGLILAFGIGSLYPWAADSVSDLVAGKAAWLNRPFFIARAVLVLVIWSGLIAGLARCVLPAGSARRLRRTSALFLVVMAPTLSVASWDWAMSLEPEWFSTMWAVYMFAGAFTGGIAAVTLLALGLDSRGLLPRTLSEATRHDLGKLLFAFTSFWAYIWFCQYMLIWYANIPEEATWFAHRIEGGWATLFWLNPILNWVVPFLALMSVRAKRDPSILAQVAGVVLIGRWLDTYLMVEPALGPSPGIPYFGLAATALTGVASWMLLRRSIASQGPRSA